MDMDNFFSGYPEPFEKAIVKISIIHVNAQS